MQSFMVELPASVENLVLPDPNLLTFYKNLEGRILWLDHEVDDRYLEYTKLILRWNLEDKGKPVEERQPIRLFIFSPGGSLYINNLLTDCIAASKTPVYGYNMGMAFSSGCLQFMACHKRLAAPSATFLLHKGSSELGGDAVNIENASADYKRKISQMIDFVVEHSTISKQMASKKMNSDWYITAQEAMEKYGFVDAIITDLEQVM